MEARREFLDAVAREPQTLVEALAAAGLTITINQQEDQTDAPKS
jgi:hypothetical protein